MDYVKEARELVQNLDQHMGPSPYDIAWLARLKEPPNGEPRWPELVEWLIANQKEDGSWGGKIVYYHDRIICTLASAIALHENKHFPGAQQATRRAEQYLWHHLHMLPRDPFELVGFELIFPTLLIEARKQGLDVPNHACGYGKIQTDKLRLIPPEMFYSPKISTIHSLEFLGEGGDVQKMRLALAPNGSLGNSPATTAYYLLKEENQRALDYLKSMLDKIPQVIYLYPFRIFELIWTLKNLSFCRTPITEFVSPSLWKDLDSEITCEGIGLDKTFGIPDGDITSVYTQLLIQAGREISPSILERFENKETQTFRTYKYERNASVGTNVHALEALDLLEDYPKRKKVQEQILLMLLSSRQYNIYWIDKWHTSPYYATTHVLMGLLNRGSYLINACENTIDWLLHTQREDGSWGFFEIGTPEETAYALIALVHYHHQYENIDFNVLQRGFTYLEKAYEKMSLDSLDHPELWIGKCLYMPYDIVRSAILVSLILYKETFG